MSTSSRKAFPSSLLTSPSVRGLIFLAAISQARVFLPHLKLLISMFSSTFNLQNFTTALFRFLSFFSLLYHSSSVCLYASLSAYFSLSLHIPTLLLSPILPSLPPTITPSYSYWTSNRIHFPWRAGLAPVSCSWSLSEHLCLTAYKWAWTPGKQDTHTDAHTDSLHNHKCCAVVTSVTNQDLCWPLRFQRHRLIVLPCTLMSVGPLTLWCHLWPLIVELKGVVKRGVHKTCTNYTQT